MPDGCDGALPGFAQQVLEFGEGLFDRIEIGAVGRQIEEPGAGCADRLPDSFVFVTAEVVEDDRVAMRQLWNKHLLNIGEEAFAIDRAIEDVRSDDAGSGQPGDEGLGQPMAVRNIRDAPFAHRTPAIKRRHVGLGPCLIDTDKTRDVNVRLHPEPRGAPPGHVGPLLFGGVKRFF